MPNYEKILDTGSAKTIVSIPGWAQDMIDGAKTKKAGTPQTAWAAVPLLFRAVNLRCNSLSSVPYVIMKGDTESEWPEAFGALPQLLYKMELAMLLCGVSYVQKIYMGRTVVGLKWLNPQTIEWKYDAKTKENTFIQEINGTVTGKWGSDEIIVTREPSILADVGPGVAPASVALTASQLRFFMDEFASSFFEHGAQPITLLSTTGSVSDAEAKRAEQFFKRVMQGVANAWRTLFLRTDVKAEILTPNLSSMQMPELSSKTVLDISAAFDIPRSILESDAANYATSQTDMQSFWAMTIRPRLPIYESAINQQLLKDSVDGLGLVFTPENLDVFQEDEAARAQSLALLVGAGVPLQDAMAHLGYDIADNMPERAEPIAESPEDEELRAWQRYALRSLKKKDRGHSGRKRLAPMFPRG